MGRIDRATRFRVLRDAGFRCRYCGRSAPDVVLEVDHVQPKSTGGRGRRNNLAAACFDCNRGKRDKALAVPGIMIWPIADDLRLCCDCCPTCPVENVVIRPAAVFEHGDSFAMLYRCSRGHEWTSGWDREFARLNAAAVLAERLPYWPALAEGY